MKSGCGTVLFNQLDLYGALQHIAWAGYQGAELACMANMAQHVELNTSPSYIDQVKATVRKHGLKLFAIEAFFGNRPDDEKIKLMTKVFDVAQKLDIPVVAIRSEGKAGDKEATRQVLGYLGELCKLAESRGVKIAVKPHVGHSFHNTETMLQLLNAVNSPALGVNLDASNFFRDGDDPAEAVIKLGNKIFHAHIRDTTSDRNQGRTPLEMQIAGRGMLDWPQILSRLKAVGYDGALDTQIIGAFTSPLSMQMGIAAEARGYLNRCLRALK